MCVCIRWVNDEYEVSEDLIGLMQVPQTDSSTLFGALRDVCIRCMLPFEKCRGQAYDGAANMSGHLNGVAACVKHEQSAALHVYCLAHSLNLCLQDVARVCETIREGLHLVMELIQLIKWSPKRSSLFEELKGEMSLEAHDLRPLCLTRWTVRTGAIHAVIESYATLCQALDEIHASGRDEYAMKAGGFLQQMKNVRTFFGLKLGYLVFSITEQLSVTLQRKDTAVQEANEDALLSGRYLSQLSNEEEYGRFYEQIVQSFQGVTEGPVLPRKRKIPRHVNDGADPHQYAIPKDHFRQQCFQVLDVVTNELSRRFDQQDLKTVVEMEKMLLAACDSKSDKEILIPQLVERVYEKDLQEWIS